MKKTLTLAFLASVLVAGSAQAETKFAQNDVGYCQSLARITVTFAEAREDGQRLEEVLELNEEELADGLFNNEIKEDLDYVAEYVHFFPRQTPTQEGNGIYSMCRE